MIVSAPAKINLTLEVVELESNGYHALDTIFCWLDLEDTLELEKADQTSLHMTSDVVDLADVGQDENNLVLKALRAMEKAAGRTLPTQLELVKRIPSGGGLGGGSADAAATLFGLNILHGLGLSQEQMMELARPLGADVAFGLVGGAARGTRYGDVLEPCSLKTDIWELQLVLVMPDFGCPTPAVYKLWDENPSHPAKGCSERFLQARSAEEQLGLVANDLEEPAFLLRPELREYKKLMSKAGLSGVCLSGSGSTLFGFLPPAVKKQDITDRLAHLPARFTFTKLKESNRFGLVS